MLFVLSAGQQQQRSTAQHDHISQQLQAPRLPNTAEKALLNLPLCSCHETSENMGKLQRSCLC